MTQAAVVCPACTRAKRSPAAWRYEGESCGHVECPNRKPLTACPPNYLEDLGVYLDNEPMPERDA